MKLALCNEVLGDMPFDEQCSFSKSLGYEGLELAPYTVDAEPHLMSADKRQEIKRIAEDSGTPISGSHWLLVTPEGLSITTDDNSIRNKTIEIMRRLIELCAHLGGAYLVHGSPGQRRLPESGKGVESARIRGVDAWAAIAEEATQAGVVYCIEALAKPEANFVNYVADAVEIVDQINSPGIRTMVDCSAASQMEKQTVAELIDFWLPSGHMAHIQVNDANRRGPGQGLNDMTPVVAALKRNDYTGWIGVEPFVYEPDGPATAAFSAGYMQALIEQ
ncbi:sugar phosphate isomerase/epimerase family protein [Pseudomonadota bacterium]